MVLDIRKFSSLESLNAFIKGRLRGSTDLVKTPSSLYLHGRTLIFATPAATVTFAASPTAAQVPLTKAQVKTQIEAQAAGVLVSFVQGAIELRANPAGTLVLDKDGTANALLGFPTKADTTVTPVSPPGGSNPEFISVGPEGSQSTYLLTLDVT